jgi:beta-galactosidase
LLARLVEHAKTGAHVILTFQSGYADEWSRARWITAPGLLRDAVGAHYQEYTTLPRPVGLVERHRDGLPPIQLPAAARGEAWADLLVTDTADVLATFVDPFLAEYAAITTNAVGAGRMTWFGTLPDPVTTARVISWALEERSLRMISARWGELPAAVRVVSGTRHDGSRLWFVANHSWNQIELEVPRGSQFLDITADGVTVTTLALAAWDSRILQEV